MEINSNFVDEDELVEIYSNLPLDKCPKTSTMITTTSAVNCTNNNYDNKLNETNHSHKSSQLNSTECNYLMNIGNADINSQDEKMILNIVTKNKNHIFPSSTQQIDNMDTQQFMDLNFKRVALQLHECQPDLDVNMKQSDKNGMESDDSVVITPPSLSAVSDGFKNSNHGNKDAVIIKGLNTSTILKNTFSKTGIGLINQDKDSEINHFRAMCEEMAKIGTTVNQMKQNSDSLVTVKNQVKKIILKRKNEDEISVYNIECIPSTSKLICVNSNGSNHTNDISKSLKHKRYHCNSPTLNLFSDSSSEYFNESSPKRFNNENETIKLNSLQSTSNIHSRSSSEQIISHSNLKATNPIIITLSEDEEDGNLIKNQSSKFNRVKKSYECERVHKDSSEQNKHFRKDDIFYCSPDGLIHRDMMIYINKKKCS